MGSSKSQRGSEDYRIMKARSAIAMLSAFEQLARSKGWWMDGLIFLSCLLASLVMREVV